MNTSDELMPLWRQCPVCGDYHPGGPNSVCEAQDQKEEESEQ
jgi:hypothetical protein